MTRRDVATPLFRAVTLFGLYVALFVVSVAALSAAEGGQVAAWVPMIGALAGVVASVVAAAASALTITAFRDPHQVGVAGVLLSGFILVLFALTIAAYNATLAL